MSAESRVPITRLSRLGNYLSLGLKLTPSLARNSLRKFITTDEGQENMKILSEDDLGKIVDTLCHMRGAALKLGQIISIQDNNYIR